MNLKTGNLYWPTTYTQRRDYPPLEEDRSCDVLIVGGGMSGAHCAYFLGQAGVKTILVDKREIGSGSTSANTGLLQFCNDKMLTACINSFGEEKAVRFYKRCEEAIGQIGKVAATLPNDPDFYERSSFYYASVHEDIPMLQKEYEALRKHGFKVEAFNKQQIEERFPFSKEYGIYTGGDAEVNPFKMAHGLMEKAVEFGVQVYGNTEVVSHVRHKDGSLTFMLKNKRRIHAKKAIFAPGYEGQEIIREKDAVLESSYALVTDPIPDLDWYEKCLIWETARPYLYVRTTVDHRIVIGGFDEETTKTEKRDSMLLHKKDLLMEELHNFFPSIKTSTSFYWGATFGSMHDGMPIIGEYDGYEGCYFLLGYGGNGTVYSMILSQIIRDLIVKGSHEDAALFMCH